MFTLSRRSLHALQGVHPDLVRVVKRAIELTTVDFVVTEGLRSHERQVQLMKTGATRTLNSRHLSGHAIDVAALSGGQVRWDWPLFHSIAAAMKQAAGELQVSIIWGGDWTTFKDGPHFELNRRIYPATATATHGAAPVTPTTPQTRS